MGGYPLPLGRYRPQGQSSHLNPSHRCAASCSSLGVPLGQQKLQMAGISHACLALHLSQTGLARMSATCSQFTNPMALHAAACPSQVGRHDVWPLLTHRSEPCLPRGMLAMHNNPCSPASS